MTRDRTRPSVNRGHLTSVFSGQVTSALTEGQVWQSKNGAGVALLRRRLKPRPRSNLVLRLAISAADSRTKPGESRARQEQGRRLGYNGRR
jgi:hypothetical protein